jgi:hypothetical protein
MSATYLSVAKVATIGNGTQEHAFSGKEISLDDLLSKTGFSRSGMSVRIKRDGRLGQSEKSPEKVRIQDGDVVFLVPPVRGGSK